MKYPVITPEERRQRLEPPRKKIHVVIDSDTYNEVDDQFAISYAMLSPEKIQMVDADRWCGNSYDRKS